MAMVPEGGRLFPFLTVEENLELGAYAPPRARDGAADRRGQAIFPILGDRRTSSPESSPAASARCAPSPAR